MQYHFVMFFVCFFSNRPSRFDAAEVSEEDFEIISASWWRFHSTKDRGFVPTSSKHPLPHGQKKYMAQSPKGRLRQGLHMPKHGNCAIYFYPDVQRCDNGTIDDSCTCDMKVMNRPRVWGVLQREMPTKVVINFFSKHQQVSGTIIWPFIMTCYITLQLSWHQLEMSSQNDTNLPASLF